MVSEECTGTAAAFSIDDPMLAESASEPSHWAVLPSGRLGLPLPKRKCGKQTYLSTDGHTRLCEHGENQYSIASWRGRSNDAACTCLNLDGLTAGRTKKAPVGWTDPPIKYYDVLCASGAEQAELPGGREARRIPHTEGRRAMWMLACGNIRCRHGNSQAVLREIKKGNTQRKIRRICDCEVSRCSWRRNRLQTRKVHQKAAQQPESPTTTE